MLKPKAKEMVYISRYGYIIVGLSKQAFLLGFLLFFTALRVFAVPLENLVSPAHAQQLRASAGSRESNNLIIQTHFRNTAPVLMPRNSELQQIISTARNTLNPNIIVESLCLYRKPEKYHTDSDSWDNTQRTGVFNQTLALSTLTGIQYYSASRSEMRTFYEYSGVIDGPQTKKPIPDPVYAQPVSLTLHARQTDLTFGDNIYRYEYTSSKDAIVFTQENVTTLSVGVIPVIGKGNLRSVMAIIDCGDSILIYAASMVNAFSVPGIRDRISNSFKSRAEAVVKWFSGRLERELFK